MALAANYFIMSKANLLALFLAIFSFPSSSHGLTKNFVNSSMPDMRPTFVVNFDMATVICQHSENPEDLHLHEISILCDGKNDCFNNPAMDDESFPYCEGKCNSTCNDRGACLYDGEKAQCYCNSGYHGPSCEITDKNECQDKPCHWLAKCTNTINSTKCDCFPGFKGDGFECTDVDECAENLANCPEYSKCVNLPGTYFCNCTTGFMPKSALMPTCIDIDECSTDMHNCADNELCQNTFGSFECVKECSKGYQLNGTVCDDVDECLESNRCDKRATCENTNGGYKCICDEGFTGDGHACSPITDCSKNENICHRHGFCIASLKMCICETGYAGDGLACHDINECETSENPCKDQSDNKCVNIEGGYICCDSKLNDQECIEEKGAYCSGGCGLHAICFNQTCTCVDGFEGDPKVKCNDVDECEDDSTCPGVGQWCVNMIGGHICCGRDSTHPECKGLEINAFNGNFEKGSISNAQLTEARSRGFFTHIIEKGGRQENSSGGVVVVVRGNESDSSSETLSSNGITFTFEIPTCNDNRNTTICPSNSECKQGRCMCVDGFEWNRKSGSCLDVDECETLSQPCLIGADVWCINLVGSYQCCNKSSSESECLGLEISAVDISTGEGGLHTSVTGENGTKKKNQWVIETFGEWRNVSGGRAIVIEGKLASNVTETSTISSTTMGSVTEIIPLTGASFSTIADIKENGTGVTNNKEKSKSTTFSKNSVSSIAETPEQDQTTISIDLNESSSIKDTQFTTPLTPKAAPEQPKSINPITKILEDLGIITTKKVTSKPIQLITAGPNSIEALDLNVPNDLSSTSNYFESTTVKNDKTSTVKIKTTSTFATKITKSPNAKTTSKKLKIPPKLKKPWTKQPSTTLEITVPETNFTTKATTEISTTSSKTSTKIPKVFKTTSRMVDDTELSRSTDVTQSGENVSAAYLEKLTSAVTESSLATTPHTSTVFVKPTTKKASKPKKRPKTTKKVNVKKPTTGLPKVITTTPVEPEASSPIPFFTTTSEKTTTENEEKFEMEVMVTMRSTTDKSTTTTTKSSDITKHTSTVPAPSYPTTRKKGTEKTDYALPTTIPSAPLSTELDIFIPNTPPVSTTKAPFSLNFLNMTLPELNFTISPSAIISNFDAVTTDKNVSTDVSIFTTTASLSTFADFDIENESVKTTKFQSSTNVPISNLSVENLFPLPPNIDIESITPEDITAQKFYTFSAQSVVELKDNNSDNMPNSTPSITTVTEEMFNAETTFSPFETTTEIEDVSNISMVSRTEESNFTTLPYPKIIFTNNQKSTTESQMIFSMIIPITETTKLVATTTPFTNTELDQNEITSITSTISSQTSHQNPVSSTMPNILGSTTKRYHKVSADNLTHDNTFLTSTNPPLTTDKILPSAYTTKRKGMEMIFVDETTLASTKLMTITPIVDLTEIPNGSTSTEVLTSDEKGLEISVITPFKQASSTEIPDSGEMGLEISGKSSTSAEPNETTNIVQTSTAINLPETEIENPESGEHLTQEEIERLRKIEVNRTSTTTMLLTTINPSVTQASLASTTEDLSKVKSGEMGLELSGASTPASAEEFTSEPATAISTTTENEKVSTAKAPDFTTGPEVSISTTKAENSKERSTTESESPIIIKTSTLSTSSSSQERTTVSAAASLTPEVSTSAKTTPKTEEGSFEKVPKSGEMGLELSGVSTPSSAEEFTSEPATAISTTTENEKASTKKTADFTTESAVPTSTVEEKSSQEQVTTESETLTTTRAEPSTSTDKSITPKSKEGSFEKIPKSKEVGLEIGGNDLSGSTETTLSPTSQTEVEQTTSFGGTALSTSPETLTSKKAATDSSEETTLSPSLTPESSTVNVEDTTIADNVTLTSTSPTTDVAEITSAVTNTETSSTIGKDQSSTSSPLLEKDTSPFAETTEKIRSSSSATSVVAEESSTASSATESLAPSTTENISTLESSSTTQQTITATTGTSSEETHEATEISATPAISTSAPITSPATEQSKVSQTPGEEKNSTTGDEVGLELTGKGFTTTPTAPTTEVEEETFSNTISTDVQETTSAGESSPATNNVQTETVPTPAERLEFTSPVETKESTTVTISNPSSTEFSTTAEQKTTLMSVTEQPGVTTEASSAVTPSTFEITTSDKITISSSTFGVTSRSSLSPVETTEGKKTTLENRFTLSTKPPTVDLTIISSTEPGTTQGAADSTTSSVQTTENASTEKSTFAITESGSTTASSSSKPSSESSTSEITVISTEISSTTPTSTSEPLTAPSVSVITEAQTMSSKLTTPVSLASSEPPLIQSESTVFEATYATNLFTTVLSSTEISVTDTLPTAETLTPAETTVIYSTTEINVHAKEEISTHLTEEATAATPIETVGDFTTIIPSETTPELLPPIIIVDQSRSHEEVDENSQLRSTSTQQPATDTTKAETSPFTTVSKTKCLSNDACENDSYCERRSGVCRCKPGFEGEPPQNPCQDIDECKQNIDDCHSSSRCLNYNGGYHCVCAIGYRKNAIGVCEDVDECAMSNGTICDSHAICRNLPGAYLCECNAGYTGDGYNCISIEKRHCNQNEWAKSDCGRNHFCLVDGNGKIDCDVCKNGFVMKNGICSDINECDENSKLCHSDAICQNIMGGYQCRCQPGYAGDGHNCQDIDECGLQNSCHPQATCVNTPGSFMCECPEGWTGDGKNACLNPADQKCSQRSEICKNGRNNSACLSLKTGDNFQSTCECLPNYRYNSTAQTCVDIDECLENRDNCDTANTVCVNTVGGFQCHCAAGYEGSGGICADIDECKRGLAGCHVNAHCINRIGGVECRCGAGYTGDGTDCFPLDNRQVGGSDCSEDWVNMCRSQNKTCHIDDEEVPQCGSCMFGYQPMDGKCQPINALGNCADPSKNDCDANAECIDVRPGRHFCSCKIGFIGDGMHCDDVDECSIPRLCDFHATCKNTNGSYECQCKEGFIGNGFKCVPANQSQNCRISPDICHSNAGCQPDGTCKCLRGYEGDGVTECKRSSVTDSFDENETSTSRRPYFTTESFFTSTVTDRHCSARDRTACHVLATCDLDTNECVCRQGFMGDGYIACTRIWEDCTADTSMCHLNAACDSETKQCQCNLGYIGDGISCVPDKMDCVIRSNLCSEMAECVARRCVCGPGFTGDGSVCMPIEPPQFIAGNCSLCHIQAICANGGCQCGQGCFGNGALCVPDPEDCINYPGVCHMNGYCETTSRRCSCRKGFSGNGIDCSKRISCTTNPSICHKDATCLSDGRCECKRGLMGDGVECLKPLTAAEIFGTSAPQLIHFECPSSCGSNAECINGACKCSPGYIADEHSACIDIDECKMQTAQCHINAQCINQEGTYECRCLSGYSGNGKECSFAAQENPDGLKVECKDDGINVVLVEETSSFNGRIFVRGQSENPFCTKTFNGSETLPLAFHVPIAHCDMQLEANDTLAVTVIIQKHPMFVTEQAYAYRLKCTYPTATRNIMSHYNVSEITTAETINTKGVEPACQLTVTNERNVTIDSAIVGQVLKLALFVLPNDSFTVLPRNCYAINLETSQRYTLTDEVGCAIDAQLFPEWTRINPSLTHAVFRTFKWPDSSMIRFECDCSACVTDCPEINCERRREEQKAKMRVARDDGAVFLPESQDALWLKNGQTIAKPSSAYSAVVVVMDDAEEQLAQKQVEDWLYKGSLHDTEFFSNLDEDRICVSAPWAVLCLFSILISVSLLLTMTQIYKRRISKKKAELRNHATNYNDNNSAYIKF